MSSVVGKLSGRVLIKRVRAGTECAIGEEQCGFRQGRGCMDEVFAVRQVCEKYLANRKDVFWAFMDLEKAYDVAAAKSVWSWGKMVDRRAVVWVGNDVSERFPVNVRFRQCSVIYPFLFNICMDGVVREVNVTVLGKGSIC